MTKIDSINDPNKPKDRYKVINWKEYNAGRLCCMNIFYFVFRDFAKHFQQEEIFMKFK
jgi:hypothetical protein